MHKSERAYPGSFAFVRMGGTKLSMPNKNLVGWLLAFAAFVTVGVLAWGVVGTHIGQDVLDYGPALVLCGVPMAFLELLHRRQEFMTRLMWWAALMTLPGVVVLSISTLVILNWQSVITAALWVSGSWVILLGWAMFVVVVCWEGVHHCRQIALSSQPMARTYLHIALKIPGAIRVVLEAVVTLTVFGLVEGQGEQMFQMGWAFVQYLVKAYGPVEPLILAEVGIYLFAEGYIRFCHPRWARYAVAGLLAAMTLLAGLAWSGIVPLPIPFIPIACIGAGIGTLITTLIALGGGRQRVHIPMPILLVVTGKLLWEFTIDAVSRAWSVLTVICMSIAVYSYTAMLLLNSSLPQDFLKGRGVFVGQLLLILLLSFNVAIVTGSMSLFHNLVGRRALRRLMRQLMAARLDGSASPGADASLLTQLASLVLSPTEDLVNMAYPLFLCTSVFLAIGVRFIGLAVVAAIGVVVTLALNFWIGAKIQAASTALQSSLKHAQNEVLDVSTEEAVETIRQYGAASLFEKRFAETTKRSGFLGIARRMLMRANLFQVAQIQNLTAFAALFLLGFHISELPESSGAWLYNLMVAILNAISLSPATAASAIVATAGVLNYLSTYVSQISQSYGQWVNNIALYAAVFDTLQFAKRERTNLTSRQQKPTPHGLTSIAFDMSLLIIKRDELSSVEEVVKTVNVDGTLAMGQVVGIVGPSGVGKSMILRSLYGVQPYNGTIHVVDEAGLPHDLSELGRGTVVLMTFQDPPAFSMTVLENLLVERFVGNDAIDVKALASQALEQVGLLSELTQQGGLEYVLGTRGGGVSGGQRMRIAIARALLLAAVLEKIDPTLKLVFAFDESTGPLDRLARKKVMRAFRALASLGHLVLLVIHHLAEEEEEELEDKEEGFDSFLKFVPNGMEVTVHFVKTV